jgi:DNA-binding SARP family transcriptional activator/Tfp pilus assembly protein PilF
MAYELDGWWDVAEFRVLGSVEVDVDGAPVDVGPARQRSVLAVLLLDANRCVPADRIVERVWGDRRLPDRPRNAVQTYVSLLRRALGGIGQADLVRQSSGYVLRVDEKLVDVHAFRTIVGEARSADDGERAAELFSRALGLWRGEAFGVLDTPWLNSARTVLDKERLAAERDLADIRLRNGQHGALLAWLSEQAEEHPLDERLAGQLMLALLRSGRQADALQTYQRIRERLTDELGADPGHALRRLHHQILTDDPALTVLTPPARGPGPGAPSAGVPRQLPAAPRLFTGRSAELAMISDAVDARDGPPDTTTVVAISGGGGIGKTWLALQWAHQNLDRFPDGQLYVNLRGFDPYSEPLDPYAALRGFLFALGVDPAAVPLEADAQAGLYRTLVADKRVLIVLDNARDTAQVGPLLPGSPACPVLVTSRRHLAGLVAAHGAHPLTLDVLSEAESSKLLARHLGRARVAAEPDALSELSLHCAGLPLAIGVVAARAVTHPQLSLAAIAGELRDASTRLDALEAGELDVNVRAALSWSYRALTPEARRIFALVALAPGADIDVLAVSSLVAAPPPAVRAVLRDLEHAHLLQQHTADRYRMHDLVRLYGMERARNDHPPQTPSVALRRLIDYYLHTAYAGDRLLAPQRPSVTIDEPAPGCVPHPPADAAAALAWFGAEQANLFGAQQLAGSYGWHSAVWQLAWTLNTYQNRRGHVHEQVVTWQLALAATEQLDDAAARMVTHRWLGHAYAQVGREADGLDHLYRALTLAEQTGDTAGQAHTHHSLARAWEQRKDDHRALTHSRQALHLFQSLGNPVGEAQALNALGWYEARLGNYTAARTACQAALALHRRHQYPDGEAGTLHSLGYIAHHVDDHEQALAHYGHALAIYHDRGNAYSEADALDDMAVTHLAADQREQARATWTRSLELYRAQHRTGDADRVGRRLAALAVP